MTAGSACDVVLDVFADGAPRKTPDVIAALSETMPAATVRSALLRLAKRGALVNNGKRGSTPATWSLTARAEDDHVADAEGAPATKRRPTAARDYEEAVVAYRAIRDRILCYVGPFADGFRLAVSATSAEASGDAAAMRATTAELEAAAFDAAVDGYIVRPPATES